MWKDPSRQRGVEEKGALWWRLEPKDVKTSSAGAGDRHGSHGPTALSLRGPRPAAPRVPLSSHPMLIKPLLLVTRCAQALLEQAVLSAL